MATSDNSSQSYLSKLSPWSKSPNIAPSSGAGGEPGLTRLQRPTGPDHMVSSRHRVSLSQYPHDCPPMRPQWFHAVDVPKRRPHPAGEIKSQKPLATPKKYAAFSKIDSQAIEAAFQKLVKEGDFDVRAKLEQQRDEISRPHTDTVPSSDPQPNTNLGLGKEPGKVKVPVNEDYLFDVDIEERELAPTYWLGPVYDVRRGTWFYQDGSVQRPCDENLAAQLEEGYLKVTAWRLQLQQAIQSKPRSNSQPRARPSSWAPGQVSSDSSAPQSLSNKPSHPDLRKRAAAEFGSAHVPESVDTDENEQLPNNHRLFGTHMNSVVTYQDEKTAWLLTDDFMSRMNFSMYRRFAGGGHFAGVKLTRGYVSPGKKTDSKDEKSANKKVAGQETEETTGDTENQAQRPSTSETRRQNLQRQMSYLLEDPTKEDPAKQDEEVRRRDEREIEDDYREAEGDDQSREIEHLILVTHGIGQRLGLRMESINFLHDVNTLRKTIKAVYADSPDLRALNGELDNSQSVNSRVQVLPICWRHLLDFPKQSLRHNRKEYDLADTEIDEQEYPTLDDIAVEGVPAVRNIVTDLALDILLYDSSAYKEHITSNVLDECNRIYHLFMKRNPNFNGKISLIGHSLGSAIMFDILCRQGLPQESSGRSVKTIQLDFEVEDFYALGSPIGLFQMLAGRTISARNPSQVHSGAKTTSSADDPMLAPTSARQQPDLKRSRTWDENPVSRPKCAQVFNIFHPTDPISYRIEPLISPAMASLKPQPLPYTKRGIFGAPVGQGLTGIGARVSQSVSSMWSNMASNFLTRGLGYTGEESSRMSGQNQNTAKSSGPLSIAHIPDISSIGGPAGGDSEAIPPTAPLPAEGTEIAKVPDNEHAPIADTSQLLAQRQQHPPTLIDAELETLYGGFQKRRKSIQSDSETRDLGAGAVHGRPEWAEAEERGKRLRKEEEKVRKLNNNGRVDYAIQEGVFDINLIAAIASHLSYWSDEDVSHFIVSQLLSRSRIVRPREPSEEKSG